MSWAGMTRSQLQRPGEALGIHSRPHDGPRLRPLLASLEVQSVMNNLLTACIHAGAEAYKDFCSYLLLHSFCLHFGG